MNLQEEFRMNKPGEGYRASLRSRVIVAIILILILVPMIFLGSWYFFVVMGLFLAIGVYEIMKAPGKKYGWWVWAITYISTFLYVYWFVLKTNLGAWLADPDGYVFSLEEHYGGLTISIIGIATTLASYFLIALLDKGFDFGDVAYFFLMTFMVGIGFQSLFFLRYYPFYLAGEMPGYQWYEGLGGSLLVGNANFRYLLSSSLFFLMASGTIINDTCAYFGGIYFGKHKLTRISPKKTWEGFVFGVLGSFLANCVLLFTMAGTGYPILPTLDLAHWYWILLVAIAIPLIAVLGDLSLSLIKRYFSIKDFGTVLRGHGGVLDRADSIMFVSIGLSILMIFIGHGWNFFI